MPSDGICLALTDLSASSLGKDYTGLRPDVNWFIRLQWGYGTTGTIPASNDLDKYLKSIRNFLLSSRGIYAVIVGNEPNMDWERPNGMVITPEYYFEVYRMVASLVKGINPKILVAPAAYAPYNANPTDWLIQFQTVLSLVSTSQTSCDFINIHAYLRGSHPSAATSEERMTGAPLTGQYASFRTYRDALNVVPTPLRRLPAFITECDENLEQGWVNENTGVVKAVYREIDRWNEMPNSQKIRGVVLYRWPKYDKFFIEGKQGVIDDFAEAIAEGSSAGVEAQHDVFIPFIEQSSTEINKNPYALSMAFERDIDEQALDRGVDIHYLPDNVAGWRVVKLEWLDVEESRGRHHIYYDVINLSGNRVVAKDLIKVVWNTGADSIDSEEKKGEPYSANFPMSSSRNDYSTWVIDGSAPSEKVTGIGMGADLGGGFNASEHTSTAIVYQYTLALEKPEEGGQTPSEEQLELDHPVVEPLYRVITQRFGENPDAYQRFGLPGHNGVDFATPLRSEIQAVDDGVVTTVQFDQVGFGHYVKITHRWGESLYAHLSDSNVNIGWVIKKGDVFADSGNTGNSDGPHLHFGIRPYPLNTQNGYNGYVDPLPFLGEVSAPRPPFVGSVPSAIKAAAKAGGMDWRLLASLAWAESSFRAELEDGLFQIGDMAWADHAPLVGAKDINNPFDNAAVAVSYYHWLLRYYNGREETALQAWNFGVGNVDSGLAVPAITQEFVNKVRHGRDLLKALGV